MKMTRQTSPQQCQLLTALLVAVAALSSSCSFAFTPTPHSYSASSYSASILGHKRQSYDFVSSFISSSGSPNKSNRPLLGFSQNLRSDSFSTQLYSSLTDADQQQQQQQQKQPTVVAEDDPQLASIQNRLDRTDRINKVALTNAFVVGSCVFTTLYVLFAEKVGALAALYDYGLGPTDQPDLTHWAISLDLLARVPFDAVAAYEQLVPTNPVFFKACTSGVAYALGDFLSQLYQGRTLEDVDLPRSARSGAAGFIAHGPLCHYWLLFMETYLDFGGAWWATGIKVTADLTVWSIFLNTAYSTIIGLLAFRNPIEVLKDVRATTWPALRSAWRFWPFVHTVSFSHAVPLDLKLLWVDVMEVVWVTILSKVANEDKNAAKEEEVASIAVETESDNAIQTSSSSSSSSSSQMTSSSIPLFELPQKALAACWPLIAMWPVLYAGYELEVALGFVHRT